MALRQMKEDLLAGLLLFRLLYYIVPFGFALALLGLRELWLGWTRPKVEPVLDQHTSTATYSRAEPFIVIASQSGSRSVDQ